MKNSFSGHRIFYDPTTFTLVERGGFKLTPDKLNPDSIYDFLLYGAVLPPQSIFQNILSLFPGQAVLGDQLVNHEYRTIAQTKTVKASLDYFVNLIDQALKEYFEELISKNKKIALSLSGGLDSAILASYLPPKALAVTWAGWGEQTTDNVYAKKIVQEFNLRHVTVLPHYDEDEALFKKMIAQAIEPFKFTALAHIKLARAVNKELGPGVFLVTGDNADTLAGSFGEVVYSYFFSYLNYLTHFLPWQNIYNNYKRKFFLLSSTNPIELAAFFHSNGIYPGPWIKVDKNYFQLKTQQIEQQLGHKIKHFNDYILMGMLLTGVVRQVNYARDLAEQELALKFVLPYFNKKIVSIFLSIPFDLRRRAFFGKVVLKRLALKRRVPHAIIKRSKKGMSYGYRDYINQKLHLPIWAEMEADKFINQFINIKMIRQKNENNFAAFDVLRSLYYYFKAHKLN